MSLPVELLRARTLLTAARTLPPLVRCIELRRVPVSAMAEDVYRLFSRPQQLISLMRHFSPEFRPQDRWVATFGDAEGARLALNQIVGKSIATIPISANLVPLSLLAEFETLNGDVEAPENCLLYTGFPPGVSREGITKLFESFQLREILFNETGKSAVIEFAARMEAHRAYRKLYGTSQGCSPSLFSTHLQLLL